MRPIPHQRELALARHAMKPALCFGAHNPIARLQSCEYLARAQRCEVIPLSYAVEPHSGCFAQSHCSLSIRHAGWEGKGNRLCACSNPRFRVLPARFQACADKRNEVLVLSPAVRRIVLAEPLRVRFEFR
jgi:hypothetical protein